MKLHLIYLFVGLLFYGHCAYAKKIYAKVLTVRGKVSRLGPGEIHPLWVKKGDILLEDTSVLTRKNSLVRLKVLDDNSSIVIGPESMMVLNKIKKRKGSIVTLLKGTLRGTIQKKNNFVKKGETKFIVKAHSVALGVRGTEFVTIVNNKNKVTSLVTLEGEVAMVKIDESSNINESALDIEKQLATPAAVVVKKGRASTSYQHNEAPTKPQKLNPVQLIALKSNKNMETDKKGKAVKSVKLTAAKKEELYGSSLDHNEEELSEAPLNGGFVDLKSGIFIPPSINKKAALGRINSATG